MVERHRVRDTGPAPVEEDQTTERCQAVEEVLVQRFLPPKIDMRRHAGEEDQVDGVVSQDLVSDPVIPELDELRRGSHRRYRSHLPAQERPSTLLLSLLFQDVTPKYELTDFVSAPEAISRLPA
jgi:hypothetical protein